MGRIPIYQIQTRTKCKHRSGGICCLRIPPPPIKIVTVLSCGVVPGRPPYSSPPLHQAAHRLAASSIQIEAAKADSALRGRHEAEAPLPVPSPRLLCRRGVRGAGVARGGGRRHDRGRGRAAVGVVGPEEPVRVHGVRADGVHLEGRHGLDDRRHAAGRGRHGDPDPGPGGVGRAHGRRPRLLRARQPGHLQRPGALHEPGALRHEPHLRRLRRAPRMVLQLPRGHGHGAPPRVRADALHRRAVARHRRLALPPVRRRRRVQDEAAAAGDTPLAGRRGRAHRDRALMGRL